MPEANEHEEVLRCLHQCAESLQIPAAAVAQAAESQLTPGVLSNQPEMEIDTRGSTVTVRSANQDDLATLIRRVAYLNTREFPAPGRRIAKLETSLNCRDGRTIHLEEQRLDVDVIPIPEPNIVISGTQDISREYEDFKLGVRIFADVHIVMAAGSAGFSEGKGFTT